MLFRSGERVNVTAAVSVSGENLLEQATNQMLNSSTGPQAGQTREYVTAFREAGFRKARMDVSRNAVTYARVRPPADRWCR